jgi:hypothetical protein
MEDRVNQIWYQMNMKEISSEEARLQILALLTPTPEYQALKELTRWIPVSERMPTEKEHGNEVFRVWVLGGETDACFVSGKIMVWVDSPFEADYEEYDPKRYKTAFTHWQRITPPEGV